MILKYEDTAYTYGVFSGPIRSTTQLEEEKRSLFIADQSTHGVANGHPWRVFGVETPPHIQQYFFAGSITAKKFSPPRDKL